MLEFNVECTGESITVTCPWQVVSLHFCVLHSEVCCWRGCLCEPWVPGCWRAQSRSGWTDFDTSTSAWMILSPVGWRSRCQSASTTVNSISSLQIWSEIHREASWWSLETTMTCEAVKSHRDYFTLSPQESPPAALKARCCSWLWSRNCSCKVCQPLAGGHPWDDRTRTR